MAQSQRREALPKAVTAAPRPSPLAPRPSLPFSLAPRPSPLRPFSASASRPSRPPASNRVSAGPDKRPDRAASRSESAGASGLDPRRPTTRPRAAPRRRLAKSRRTAKRWWRAGSRSGLAMPRSDAVGRSNRSVSTQVPLIRTDEAAPPAMSATGRGLKSGGPLSLFSYFRQVIVVVDIVFRGISYFHLSLSPGQEADVIGVGKADWVRPPLPPNRTGGFPASGSPVDGFTSPRID